MISFLQSYFLYGLAAVSLPFLIHLFNRRRSKRVEFSTIYFLQQLQQKKMRRLKIRQLLLLLLRALVIAFVVMGFARPTVRSHAFFLGRANVRTAAAIVLDNSMSMNYEDENGAAYARAVAAAEKILQLFQPGDQLVLFLAAPAEAVPQGKAFESPETVLKILRDSRPSMAYGNMAEAVQRALGFLRKSDFPNRECFVLSDFQRSSWSGEAFRRLQPEPNGGIRTFLLDLGSGTRENVGVERLQLRNQMIEPGKKVVLSATVANYGRTTYQDLLVSAFLEGRRVGQSSVDLPAGGRREVRFNLLLKKSGFVQGMVEVEDDPFLPDNRAYFSLYVPERIPVLLVGNADNYTYFKLALAPHPQRQQLFSFTESPVLSRVAGTLQRYSVVALVDVPRLSDGEAAQLVQFIRGGGRLIVFPGKDTDLRALNERLFAPLGLPVVRGTRGKMGDESSAVQWGETDLNHPILKGIFRGKVKEINSPDFYFRLVFGTPARGESLIRFEDRTPFMSLIPAGKGSVLLFASALDPEWSDFVYKPIFPPLMYRSVLYLASESQRDVGNATIGQPLELEVLDPDAVYQLQLPSGSRQRVSPQRSGPRLILRFAQTATPGLYTLYANGKPVHQWAVNVDPRESTLERIDRTQVKQKLGNLTVVLKPDAAFYEQIVRSRYGSELTKWFFGIALGLMVLEMLLSREDLLGRSKWIQKLLKEERS